MKSLASLVRFGAITANNIGTLHTLNASIFPVKYNEKFYSDVLTTRKEFTKFGYFDGYVVAAVCCRMEPVDEGSKESCLYIMTLGVLEPYRHQNIGTTMLQSIINKARKDSTIVYIYLHVQTNNEEALAFYKSHGFEITGTIADYYKDISPPDCYILKKLLN